MHIYMYIYMCVYTFTYTYSRWTNYSNPYPWVIGHPLPPPNFNVMVS